MLDVAPRILAYLGAALMVYNIYRYLGYARGLLGRAGWERERRWVLVPTMLLGCFLVGYLVVGLFGSPDLVMGGILLGGSVFVLCMVAFLERVTNRIEEHERLAAQLAAEQESNRAKTSFLSTMSHEIRTPLNAIIGLDELMMRDDDLTPVQRGRLEKLDGSARHLLLLINDILDMSRIESGQTELAHAPFDLCDLLRHVSGIIESQCGMKGLAFSCSRADAACGTYRGDETKLSQVLINILGNSVKFTEAPGSVSLRAELAGGAQLDGGADDVRQLAFVMSDTGIGMDESFIPHLFGTFTQEDGTSTNRFGGSGLGMAISKHYVEMMGGDIAVESTKGVGTTITVTVPLEPCDEELPEQASDAGQDEEIRASLAGRHILIAEDMPINAEILIAILQMEGISCVHATDGQEAVELFSHSAEGHFDAVLMDVRMPVMDGLAAARAIRALERPDAGSVPIIALTANAFQEDVQQSLDAGMNAHLPKPVDPELLLETLGRLIAARPTRD